MFKFSELKQIQIEISSRCQASCPMCSRNIHGGLTNPLLRENDWTLENFKKIFNKEVLDQLKVLDIAGVYGEPIMNNDLLDMCKYLKEHAPNLHVNLYTNGSARSLTWWKTLADSLPKSHIVKFALDGLEDTHHLYRIGTNYNQILKNSQAFMSAGGVAEWAFIRFKHNQHQVEAARELASKLGFAYFSVKDTRRAGQQFKVLDKAGKVTHVIEQPDGAIVKIVKKSEFKNYREWPRAQEIHCSSLQEKELFIDAHYTLYPCCVLSCFSYFNVNVNAEVYKQHGVYSDPSVNDGGYDVQHNFMMLIAELGGYQGLAANDRGIKNIIESELWQTIWEKKWADKSSEVCIKFCSASSPFSAINAQQVFVDTTNN